MSHQRMLKSEQQLEAEMRALLRKAEMIDAQEDGQYGKGKRGDELPEELQRRSSRFSSSGNQVRAWIAQRLSHITKSPSRHWCS